jgi:hypothetical protein
VRAPLIKEWYVNIAYRLVDCLKKHGIFIPETVAAWVGGKNTKKDVCFALLGTAGS